MHPYLEEIVLHKQPAPPTYQRIVATRTKFRPRDAYVASVYYCYNMIWVESRGALDGVL